VAGAGQRRGAPATPPSEDKPPEFVEVVLASGRTQRLAVAQIKKANTGPITRYGQEFEFTPFTSVMKVAGIAANARVRVVSEENDEEMTLQSGSSEFRDPGDFGVIFNRRGLPVLTPKPGSAAQTTGGGGPGGQLPPPGSGAARNAPGGGSPGLPPPGSGAGRGSAAGPVPEPAVRPAGAGLGGPGQAGARSGPPSGMALPEVRSFVRIVVVVPR